MRMSFTVEVKRRRGNGNIEIYFTIREKTVLRRCFTMDLEKSFCKTGMCVGGQWHQH